MLLSTDQTVNVDAAGTTQAQIDAILPTKLDLLLTQVPTGSLVELSCNGLSFCSQGGTGMAQMEGLPQTGPPQLSAWGYFQVTPFPAASLDPATGFGELIGPDVANGLLGPDQGGQEFNLNPRATSSQIGSGDVATEVVTNNGTATDVPVTIGFVFNTVPALDSYSDTAGNSGTISYPTTVGTQNNPILLAAGPNGDVVMNLTVFRPQRAGVPGAGEPAFMDIGHLGYSVGNCPTAAYSNLSPSLSLFGSHSGSFGPTQGNDWLADSANDQSASPANTISFSVDLSQCAAASNSSLSVGQSTTFGLDAASQSSSDHAGQTFTIKRTS